MRPEKLPLALLIPTEMALTVLEAAEQAARTATRRVRHARRRRVGATLRPGPGTPLWNELLKQLQPFLTKRGTKARLARLLGLPRQRMQDCLKARIAALDSERTLFLLCWLAARKQGREILPATSPGDL